MFRVIATIAASLLLPPVQAAVSIDTAEADSLAGGALVSSALQVQVERLQEALQRHRDLAASGGWPAVPAGPTIRQGSDDSRLGVLATRLAASGDLAGDEIVSSYYDEALQDAVRRFQARHGLDADGLVGRATLRALNVPVERRIDQIRVNLERVRSLSDIDEQHFVLVNITAFKATIIRDGKALWTTKVIVGEEEDRTPELRSELRSVVFNPTWSVPHSIASEELLPNIKQDPGFFSNGGYELYDRDGNRVDPADVDWDVYSTNNFPFRLVQRPGPQNQLGRIKFMIPNPYSICMHDTPARELFASANRALSHGCIRVDDPLAFAELVLGSEGWTRAQIESQIDSGHTKSIALKGPLPVHVVYWTAEVDDNGVIHFYDDIYARDDEFLEELGRPPAIR
ncbi:MAG: L,D-transpeptidase family protein [Gammaproteobacteria bacterium]|nr:L,D-transpeptidase family protein [Gammaproteobacteria bacterium]NNC56223.1 L,D-transpeptidase family protein [Woeseiaceae bacterium]